MRIFVFALAADDAGGGVPEAVAQVLGSALARGPPRQSRPSQHSRSQATVAAAYQTLLIWVALEGRWARPVSLPVGTAPDPGVGSVACFEELGGLVGGVGGQELVAPAVDLFK
jgi:hypothetical protein